MLLLLIDDLRNFREETLPKGELVIARTSAQALSILQASDTYWDQIWFDHDLGETSGHIDNIMPVIDYIGYVAHIKEMKIADQMIIHSSNPVGVKQMMLSLQNYGYNPIRVDASKFFIVQ